MVIKQPFNYSPKNQNRTLHICICNTIRADSGHPFTLAVIADNHRVRHKMGRIGACLAPVYLVHVRHDTGVAFPVAFDRVDVSVPVLPERNPHPPEFPDDEPGHLPLLAGGGGDVVKSH